MQPDRSLSSAGRTLNAEGLAQASAHDAVLFRLDGGHDVAHRAGPRPLDVGLDDVGVDCLCSFGQIFVLVRGQLACEKPKRRRKRTPIGWPGRAW